jgi:hypothetical protein
MKMSASFRACIDDMVWVQLDDSQAYPLNGVAMTGLEKRRPDLKVGDLESIWRVSPTFWEEELAMKKAFPEYVPGSQGITRVPLNLINEGLELCK